MDPASSPCGLSLVRFSAWRWRRVLEFCGDRYSAMGPCGLAKRPERASGNQPNTPNIALKCKVGVSPWQPWDAHKYRYAL